jgi:hypothetical protein
VKEAGKGLGCDPDLGFSPAFSVKPYEQRSTYDDWRDADHHRAPKQRILEHI